MHEKSFLHFVGLYENFYEFLDSFCMYISYHISYIGSVGGGGWIDGDNCRFVQVHIIICIITYVSQFIIMRIFCSK